MPIGKRFLCRQRNCRSWVICGNANNPPLGLTANNESFRHTNRYILPLFNFSFIFLQHIRQIRDMHFSAHGNTEHSRQYRFGRPNITVKFMSLVFDRWPKKSGATRHCFVGMQKKPGLTHSWTKRPECTTFDRDGMSHSITTECVCVCIHVHNQFSSVFSKLLMNCL